MLPRKTGPAPIFNYRKRPRQAVVADPETHPSASNASPLCKGLAVNPISQKASSYNSAVSSRGASSSFAGRQQGGGAGAGNRPNAPPPSSGFQRTSPAATTATAGSGRPNAPPSASSFQRPSPAAAAATAGQSMARGNWRATDNRQGHNALPAPNREWNKGSMSMYRPASGQASGISGNSSAGPSGNYNKRQQPQCQQQPSRFTVTAGRNSFAGGSSFADGFAPSVQPAAAPPKLQKSVGEGPGDYSTKEAKNAPDRSLQVLTLPIAQLKRAFGLLSDVMQPFLFCLFGIVDSATVSDIASSGKSFTLRDETDRVTCIFCEIDRPMPRLHRGQWYRVVGVARPQRQALQCLSLRPVSVEERQAARAVTALSTSLLSDICLSVTEM